MRTETEPFTPHENEDVTDAIGNSEFSNEEERTPTDAESTVTDAKSTTTDGIEQINDAENTEMDAHDTIEEQEVTESPDVIIINGMEYVKQVRNTRLPAMVRIPSNYKSRLDAIVAKERRKVTTVVEMAMEQFIENPVCDPRPYLPFSSKTCNCRVNFYATSELLNSLEVRASIECRAVQDIMRRALVSYIEASPYDPERNVAAIEPPSVSGNLSGNVPEENLG